MKLNQITIPSNDVKASIDFYQTLGLNLIVDAKPNYARLCCPNEGTTLSISFNKIIPKSETKLYFEIENLDETVNRLKTQGLKFKTDPEDKSWLWREAHLNDPDGNTIVLYFAGENRLNPPWRV